MINTITDGVERVLGVPKGVSGEDEFDDILLRAPGAHTSLDFEIPES